MRTRYYKRKRNCAAAVSVLSSAAFSAAVYLLCGSWSAALCSLAGEAVLILVMLYILRLDDRFITETAADFSRLADCLAELQEREIFPDNEDTADSKLQSQIIKIVREMKKKKEDSKTKKRKRTY